MDDDVVGPVWQIDPDTRSLLRVERVRAAVGRGDWATAVVEAEELLDEDPDHAEALGLLATALLELGDTENAVEAFEDHLRRAPASADMLSGLALARFESCDPQGAILAAREALRLDPGLAEAAHTLGLALEHTPDGAAEAARMLGIARSLEPDAYPVPLDLDDDALRAAFATALRQAPPRIRAFWRDVPIRIEARPDLAELRASPPPLPPTMAGLYLGTPPDDDGVLTLRPEALRLFRDNLARCGTEEELARRLGVLLEQEALDWLGIDLDELDDLPAFR